MALHCLNTNFTANFLTFLCGYPPSFCQCQNSPDFPFFCIFDILTHISEEAHMNADDKSKIKAYEELIGSLEHTNGLQHKVIETQSSLIKSLEEHNSELEKIIDDLTHI